MSKKIRRRISQVIQTTFRLSSPMKSNITSCCSVKKPNDYDYVSYQPKQISTKNDYIDLSACYSMTLSYSKDLNISVGSNENCQQQLQSTKLYSNDLSFSNLSSIQYDKTMQSTTIFECCRCQCHHNINKNQLSSQTNGYYQQRIIKTKIYPFIF